MTYPNLVDSGAVLDPFAYASALVRGYCKQSFTQVVDDVVLLDPRSDGTAQLPELPVTAVSTVSAYMPQAGVWGWQTLSFPGQYGWSERGLLWDATIIMPPIEPGALPVIPFPTWPQLPASLQVTYTHGFATIPADLQAVVTRLANAVTANPNMLTSNRVGEVSTVFGMRSLLADTDMVVLDQYVVQSLG